MKKHLYLYSLSLILIASIHGMKEETPSPTIKIENKKDDIPSLTISQFSISPLFGSHDHFSNAPSSTPEFLVEKGTHAKFNFTTVIPNTLIREPETLIIINNPLSLKDLFTLAVAHTQLRKKVTCALSIPDGHPPILLAQLRTLLGLNYMEKEGCEKIPALIEPDKVKHVVLITEPKTPCCKTIKNLVNLFANRESLSYYTTVEDCKNKIIQKEKSSIDTLNRDFFQLSKEKFKTTPDKAMDSSETSTEESDSPKTAHYPSPVTDSSKDSAEELEDSDTSGPEAI